MLASTIDRNRFRTFVWIGVVYLCFWLFRDLLQEPETFLKRIINNIWLISYLVVVNFVFYEFGISRLSISWRSLFFLPVVIGLMLFFCTAVFYFWRSIGVALHLYSPLVSHSSIAKGIAYHAPYAIMSILFFGLLRHVYDYTKLREATQQLRIEKQEAELNYLKAQTNPHFLFNTLNNIYSLSRDKSDLAPESILRLSKILRYMLYETSGDYIAIEQEVRIINDYIELEKLRYDENLQINFNYNIEDMKQSIPPLLLIPLVENAFKHGVSETRSMPFVDIHLSVTRRVLNLVVRNSADSKSNDEAVKENIGLSNLRRQLQLLYREYKLDVNNGESVFTASLNINLASHV